MDHWLSSKLLALECCECLLESPDCENVLNKWNQYLLQTKSIISTEDLEWFRGIIFISACRKLKKKTRVLIYGIVDFPFRF